MSAPIINFPIASVVDGLLSYTQWIFGNPEITPAEYRWNSDDRASRIRICAPFVVDNQKPMSAPFIVIERGAFSFANRMLDNLKTADANTFLNGKYDDWCDGGMNIICGSGTAEEASSLANFLAIMFQADRHGIKQVLRFVRNLNYVDISPEIPVVKFAEVVRWEVTLRLYVSLQMGYFKLEREPELWNKAGFYAVESPSLATSESGIISEGQDTLVDMSKDFGFLTTNSPQFLQQEFSRGWYYIKFPDSEYPEQLYTPVPWSSPEAAIDVEYQIWWNAIHLRMELPNNNS